LSWKYPPFYSFRQFIIQQYKEKVKSFTGDDCKYFATGEQEGGEILTTTPVDDPTARFHRALRFLVFA
jgi:hypothetical protein